MQKFFSLLMAGLAMAAVAGEARAEGLVLGEPGYGGTGCPAGSAGVILSPDQSAVSLLFDSYVAEAGGSTGKRSDRKSCNIAIPVHVPQGFSISVIQVDYRGFNAVPRGGSTRMNAEYFWAGARGPSFSQNWSGPSNSDFLFNNGLIASAQVWTPCGADVILRVNSSVVAQTNSQNAQTMIGVDSADVSSGVVYHLQWRTCR